MSRPYAERRPTEAAAIGRATRTSPHRAPATGEQLRERLGHAISADDGHGLRLLNAHLQRAKA